MPENAAAEGGFGRDAPDRPDDNDRGGAREDRESRAEKAEAFDRAMDNANRPDRAPAAEPETPTTPDGDDDNPDTRTTDTPDDRSNPAAAPSDTGTPPSSTPPAETDKGGYGEQDERGFFDRAGDFFGGLTQGMQDFSRENPRVDSHGNPVGHVDADGIQRGEVASRVRSSGTSSEDLAAQLGFSSPQDMAAAQNTDFIGDKYQEELQHRAMVEAIENRYGPVPSDIQAMLDSGNYSLVNSFAPVLQPPAIPPNQEIVPAAGPPIDEVMSVLGKVAGKLLAPLGFITDAFFSGQPNLDEVAPSEGISVDPKPFEHTQVQTHNPRFNPSTITDGYFTVNPTDMARHKPETAPPGRSTFRSDIDAERAVLDAAKYADEHNLWNNDGKAKVPVKDEHVGYHGESGRPTYEINVYREKRNDGGYNLHGAPGSPKN